MGYRIESSIIRRNWYISTEKFTFEEGHPLSPSFGPATDPSHNFQLPPHPHSCLVSSHTMGHYQYYYSKQTIHLTTRRLLNAAAASTSSSSPLPPPPTPYCRRRRHLHLIAAATSSTSMPLLLPAAVTSSPLPLPSASSPLPLPAAATSSLLPSSSSPLPLLPPPPLLYLPFKVPRRYLRGSTWKVTCHISGFTTSNPRVVHAANMAAH